MMTKPTVSLFQAIENANLTDGATISFHHHLRNGDSVMEQVLQACERLGIRDLHIAPSSVFPCHGDLIRFIQSGVISNITTSYMNGPLSDAISGGLLPHPVTLQTHGGRAFAIETGLLAIDCAFVAAPAVDAAGNLSGADGPNACGPLGYAMVDAAHAKRVVAITDHLAPKLSRVCILADQVDEIAVVDSIGQANQIVSGTTGRAPSDRGRAIADMTVGVIKASGLLRDGFTFQTGAGATSLAVASSLGPEMGAAGITGAFAAGGITAPLVQMHREGLFTGLWDVQAFDLEAVQSYRQDPGHTAMSASLYASPGNPNAIVNRLDVMILGAAQIDTQFNVNVTQASDGRIIGGSGGHADTAAAAKLPIVTTSLTGGGFAKVVDRLTCLTTPGDSIGAVVTEAGIAIHPSRPDLAKAARCAGLPVTDIRTLADMARTAAQSAPVARGQGRVLVNSMSRDGRILDQIRQRT